MPCFSCSFSAAVFFFFLNHYSYVFFLGQTIDNADRGVVEKIEFMATQNNHGAKTSLIASVGFSHLPLSGPCYSLGEQLPEKVRKVI